MPVFVVFHGSMEMILGVFNSLTEAQLAFKDKEGWDRETIIVEEWEGTTELRRWDLDGKLVWCPEAHRPGAT